MYHLYLPHLLSCLFAHCSYQAFSLQKHLLLIRQICDYLVPKCILLQKTGKSSRAEVLSFNWKYVSGLKLPSIEQEISNRYYFLVNINKIEDLINIQTHKYRRGILTDVVRPWNPLRHLKQGMAPFQRGPKMPLVFIIISASAAIHDGIF